VYGDLTVTGNISGTATSANNLRDSSNNLVRIDGSNELNFYNSAGNAAALYINHHNSNSEVNIANSGAQIGQTYGVRVPDGSVSTPTHSFNGDTNTGIFLKSADYMAFSAGGYERFAANGNGLDLSGGTVNKIVHTAVGSRDKYRVWNSSYYCIGMDDAMTFGGLGGYAMTFQMNNENQRGFVWLDDQHSDAQGAMSLTTNGKLAVAHSIRVGYGESDTTTPGASAKLDVSGNAYISGDLWVSSKVHTWSSPTGHVASMENNGTYLMMRNPEGNTCIFMGDSGDSNNYYDNGSHRFRNLGGSTYFAAINSSGLRIGAGSGFAQAKVDLLANTSTTSDGDGTADMAISGTDSILLKGHNGGASGSNYGSIVWVGGGSRRRAMITSVADGSTDTDIIGLSFYTQGTDGSGDFSESMRIAHNGNVHFDKDVIAYSSTPSDVRLKKNFEKIENGLDVVNKLEGHTFNWKKGGDRLSAGFKAQEVEKILPHLVDEKRLPLHSDDDKEYKILRYEEMIPYLVEAIKEQQVQINELKTKLGE
jgi:hypothetical protein